MDASLKYKRNNIYSTYYTDVFVKFTKKALTLFSCNKRVIPNVRYSLKYYMFECVDVQVINMHV